MCPCVDGTINIESTQARQRVDLVTMNVKDSQPLSLVEDTVFGQFLGILDQTYIIQNVMEEIWANAGSKERAEGHMKCIAHTEPDCQEIHWPHTRAVEDQRQGSGDSRLFPAQHNSKREALPNAAADG